MENESNPIKSKLEAAAQLPLDLEEQVKEKIFRQDDAGDGTKAEDQYLRGPTLILCLLSVFLCMFLAALDQTIVATILTVIGDKFNSFDKIAWMTTGFFLPITVLAATWGKLSVIFGRKYAMIAAIILFEAGSLMCGLANDMNVLIGGRVLAGVGAGGLQSISFIIIAEVVPLNKRSLAMGLFGCVFAVASVVGPLLGGAFTSNVSWRWCFYINLPVGGVALVFLILAFKPPKPTGNLMQKMKMIDYPGTVLLCGGLVLFLLGLSFGGDSEFAWDSAAVICCLVIGILLMIAFAVWNFIFAKNPTIPKQIVVVLPVVAASVSFFAVFAFFMADVLYVSIYFQVIRGASSWESGVHLLPLIIPVVITSIATGILVKKTRTVKPFGVLAGVFSLIGGGLLCLLEVDSPNSREIGLLILVGVAIGLAIQSCVIGSQIAAPPIPGGTVMSTVLVNFSRALGGSIGSILAQTVYSTSSVNNINNAMANLKDQTLLEELSKVDLNSLLDSSEVLNELSSDAQFFIKTQLMYAIRDVFYMGLGFAAITLIATIFLTNKRLPKEVFGDPGKQKTSGEPTPAPDAIEEHVEDKENKSAGEESGSNDDESSANDEGKV